MKFGEKLQKLRKEKGMSQEELAMRLHVSRQAVSKWENDQGYPETEKMLMLGNIFSVTMDYLLKDEGGEQQTQEQGYYASRECVQGYLLQEKRTTLRIAVGTLLCILSGLPVLIFPQQEDVMSIFSMILIALGIAVFVSLSFDKDEYKILEQEPLYFDHDHLQELKEENDGLQKKFKRLIIGGLLLIFLCCIIAIVSEDVLHMEEGPMDAVYLLLISIAVFLFIYAGCSMNAYELLVDNEAYHRKKHGDRYSWLYYVTIGCASIVYVGLGMLFGKEAWRTGWLLIAIAWLMTYGIISGINMRKK
ncbi:helix-turn-helix domain-containing protein [[Clostridium] innocuum]|nr:helix-turn-helix transcriptional regulator [Erysipelotrichaceae bacterium]MCR0383680.1 helix-turn-helix domain-containing protein [[Clostridium] innocuum]MCR0415271.1 helix-turn-helix domain-containing protein [[Clostridium] innocuum]MCR0536263.1 helix-turn-helix domain-containing protein [[Clostridium] innocuum]MCR0540266.1 helix-turn-helix domain-containing protein [[Clostridium] innocuum]